MSNKMPGRVYKAAAAAKRHFPKVFAWVATSAPRRGSFLADALVEERWGLLADTLEQMSSGRDKDGKVLTDPWAYATRVYEQKQMDATAAMREAEADQYRIPMDTAGSVMRKIMGGGA